MKNRDRLIIGTLEKFKVLERDHIAQMFFGNLKKPHTNANFVLKRLRDRGYIDCDDNRAFQQYLYFAKPSTVKKNSQKIGHYLMIADIYIDMQKYHPVKHFEIESYIPDVKLIPDIYTVWGDSLWFIEAQNSIYTSKQMHDKLSKYEDLYQSGRWKEFHYQPKEKKFFPNVLIVGKARYNANDYSYRIFQADNIESFMEQMEKKQDVKQTSSKGIKITL